MGNDPLWFLERSRPLINTLGTGILKPWRNPELDTEELLKSRRTVYGDVRHNTFCQHELKQVMKAHYQLPQKAFLQGENTDGKYNEIAHYECLEYILEKLARIITGVDIHEDNYEDIKGYIELARKIAMGESTAP